MTTKLHITLIKMLKVIGIIAILSSCQGQDENIRNYQAGKDAFNSSNAKSDENSLKITEDTIAKDQHGNACKLYKDEVVYFSEYIEEFNVWEFVISRPIEGCELKGQVFINIDHLEITKLSKAPVDETIFNDLVEKPDDGNAYESSSGFGNYEGPAHKLEFFPLPQRPLDSYKTGGREFGASRSNGRLHAANDLLEYSGESVHAVTDGKILDYYYFYSGTYAIVVDHGNYVVRYGEVSGMAYGLKVGSSVKAGQTIGKVGKLYSGQSMLHFEKYSGEKTGNLTVSHNYPYQRRSDLVRPTEFLDRLLGTYPTK